MEKSYTSFELEIDKIFLQYAQYFRLSYHSCRMVIFNINFSSLDLNPRYVAQKKIFTLAKGVNQLHLLIEIISTLVNAANKQNAL